MSYIINGFNGQIVAVIADGTIDTTSTNLQLVGRSVTDYGTAENENLVWLMQNFANNTAPTTPLVGQLWYDTATKQLFVWTVDFTWQQVASVDYVEDQKVSPAFSGTPTAPTAGTTSSNTQLATTAFVQAQKASPLFTGTPRAPTPAIGNVSTQLATTEFVQNAVNQLDLTNYAALNSPAFIGSPTAPTPANAVGNTQIATTHFVQNVLQNLNLSSYALKDSPTFTGSPTAPTPGSGTSNTQLATTAFVQAQKASPAFSGTPTAPTQTPGDSTEKIATTAFVGTAMSSIDLSSYAALSSPVFSGTPQAPTAAAGTGTSQIATTAFVAEAVAGGTFTLGTASASVKGGVKIGSGLSINASTAVLTANATVSSVQLAGGSGIAITGTNPITSSGIVTVTNSGVTKIIAGSGITISGQTGEVTVGLAGGGGGGNQQPYVLPTATAGALGGVKVGSGLAIDSNGVLSANTSTGNFATLTGTQSFTGTNTFNGVTNFNVANVSANINSQRYNFSGGSTRTQFNYDVTSKWIEVWIDGTRVGVLGDANHGWYNQSVGGIGGFNTGTAGGAGIRGYYNQATPGLGVGTLGGSDNPVFGGDLIQATAYRSKSSSFDALQCYAGVAPGLTPDSIFLLRGDGNGYADGTWNGGGADYAEYFEVTPNTNLYIGTTVVLDGEFIRAATHSDSNEDIIGVVRPKGPGLISSMVGNNPHQSWNKKYLTDEFGQYVMEAHNVYEWNEVDDSGENVVRSYESHRIPSDVTIPTTAKILDKDADGVQLVHPKLNPEFNPNLKYIPREDRDEWVIVGLMGQVPVLKNQPVNSTWRKMKSVSATVDLYFIR